MEPLRIEFQLATPWSPPHGGVHFDGLVAWAVLMDAMQGGSSPDNEYDQIINDLPFERFESDEGWCWKASMLHVVGFMGQERRYLTAKTPVNNMALAIGNKTVEQKGGSYIDTVRGLGKNAATYYTLEHAQGFEAFCIGDFDALSQLLLEVHSIGVKVRLGHGSLRPYEDGKLFKITPDESAREKWMRRNAPKKLVDDMHPAIACFQPPYWKNKQYCWVTD